MEIIGNTDYHLEQLMNNFYLTEPIPQSFVFNFFLLASE